MEKSEENSKKAEEKPWEKVREKCFLKFGENLEKTKDKPGNKSCKKPKEKLARKLRKHPEKQAERKNIENIGKEGIKPQEKSLEKCEKPSLIRSIMKLDTNPSEKGVGLEGVRCRVCRRGFFDEASMIKHLHERHPW